MEFVPTLSGLSISTLPVKKASFFGYHNTRDSLGSITSAEVFAEMFIYSSVIPFELLNPPTAKPPLSPFVTSSLIYILTLSFETLKYSLPVPLLELKPPTAKPPFSPFVPESSTYTRTPLLYTAKTVCPSLFFTSNTGSSSPSVSPITCNLPAGLVVPIPTLFPVRETVSPLFIQ